MYPEILTMEILTWRNLLEWLEIVSEPVSHGSGDAVEVPGTEEA